MITCHPRAGGDPAKTPSLVKINNVNRPIDDYFPRSILISITSTF